MTFTIDNDNNITAHAELPGSAEAAPSFNSQKELTKLTSQWSIGRFVDIWNSFAGAPPFGDLKPVKKFTDRKTAVGRIWRAVQDLTPTPAQPAANVAPAEATATEESTPTVGAPKTREGSKKAIVLDMLRRAEGATLAEIMDATGWQAHSVRGFISGTLTKKLGLKVKSFRTEEKERAYRVSA